MRGAVRLHILHHAAEGEIHGSWMAAELAEHGHRISPGTLYPTLHAMEQEGLLRSRRTVVDGRARREYRATAQGPPRSHPDEAGPARTGGRGSGLVT